MTKLFGTIVISTVIYLSAVNIGFSALLIPAAIYGVCVGIYRNS